MLVMAAMAMHDAEAHRVASMQLHAKLRFPFLNKLVPSRKQPIRPFVKKNRARARRAKL